MARGSKASYTPRQKRRAEKIARSYEKRGVSEQEAKRRGWATVNEESGGGERSGSGRGRRAKRTASRKGGKRSRRTTSKTSGRSRQTSGRSRGKKK